jgi:DNA-binding transcriptional LysR family regulator
MTRSRCAKLHSVPSPKSDDLLVLVAVARHRTFSAAARELGLDHTTVARRIQALSDSLGGRLLTEASGGWDLTPLGERACAAGRSIDEALAALSVSPHDAQSTLRGLVRVTAPEAFVTEVVAPAVAQLAGQHSELTCEILSATRPLPQHGPHADLDIGVTRPQSRRLRTRELVTYQLGLFASKDYLRSNGDVRSREDLQLHQPVYYVESMLQVVDLDLLDEFFPQRRRVLSSTSVHAQLALVASGGGIGLLPTYMAGTRPELVPVLKDEAVATLTYWMAGRPTNLQRPEVAAVADAIADAALRLRWPRRDRTMSTATPGEHEGSRTCATENLVAPRHLDS